MEELIEILIRLIAGFFENKAIKPTAPSPRSSAVVRPPQAAPKAVARRQVRRPVQATIAVAKPIVTKIASEPLKPMERVINKPITESHTAPNQSAAAIRKWLTPTTLRTTFLLTEILQPPLALRKSDPSK